MLKNLKYTALSCVALVGMFVALGGIQPASIGSFHQPEPPKGYK